MPNLSIIFSPGDYVWTVDEHKKQINYGEIVSIDYTEYLDTNQLPYSETLLTVSDNISNCIIIIPITSAHELKDEALITLANLIDDDSKC